MPKRSNYNVSLSVVVSVGGNREAAMDRIRRAVHRAFPKLRPVARAATSLGQQWSGLLSLSEDDATSLPQRLAQTVYEARGGFCYVSGTVQCAEYAPMSAYCFDEAQYEAMRDQVHSNGAEA